MWLFMCRTRWPWSLYLLPHWVHTCFGWERCRSWRRAKLLAGTSAPHFFSSAVSYSLHRLHTVSPYVTLGSSCVRMHIGSGHRCMTSSEADKTRIHFQTYVYKICYILHFGHVVSLISGVYSYFHSFICQCTVVVRFGLYILAYLQC